MSITPGTVISGCGGQFVGPNGFNCKFKEWTASVDIDTENTSGFDDGAYKSNTATAIGLTGSASGWLTTATPVPDLETDCTVLDQFVGAFVLTADTGKTYTFNGIMTKSAVQRAAQKAGTTNYNFVSNGVITIAWA
jgi:hypothetical protein